MLAIPFNSKFSLSYMILLKKIVTTNQKGFFPMRTPAFNNCQRSRQKPPINIFSSFFKLLIQLLSMRQIFFLVATHFYYSFCTTIFKQLCNNIFILFWKKWCFCLTWIFKAIQDLVGNFVYYELETKELITEGNIFVWEGSCFSPDVVRLENLLLIFSFLQNEPAYFGTAMI